MKQQLTQIIESICDLIRALWALLIDLVQKIFNACRWRNMSVLGRILFSVLILATICFVGAFVYNELYEDYFGRVSSYFAGDYEKTLSESVETHCFHTRKQDVYTTRVYNTVTKKYTTPRLDWVAYARENDSLTVFSYKGKRGFLNVNDGRIVIEGQYDNAWVFSEGLAAVVKNGKIGFINARNEVVLPFQYDYSNRNGKAIDYLFRDGYCTMTDSRGACGLIDKEGNWVIEPQYDCIWTPHGAGYRIVKDGDKYGLLNPKFQFAYPIEYDYIEFAAENAGVLLSQNGRKWQVDFDGTITRPLVMDLTYWMYVPGIYDEEGKLTELSDYLEYRINDRVGVLRRKTGEIVIPAIYEAINMLSVSLFAAQLREEGDWILIDGNGKMVEN